jgi:hypothetical protein
MNVVFAKRSVVEVRVVNLEKRNFSNRGTAREGATNHRTGGTMRRGSRKNVLP